MEKPKILEKTERWAVLFKPAGMPTQLSEDTKGSSLESYLKHELQKDAVYFPHRLDRITQGLLLVAFDKETVAYFNNEIRNKRFGKYYIAKVESNITDPKTLAGVHKRFIKIEDKMSRIVKSGGLPSFLEILSVEHDPESSECCHVLIRLITGRMHQIRVMLADMGIPLCGDFLYNRKSSNKDFYLESLVLKFMDTTGTERTFYNPKNPDRIRISDGMKRKIDLLFSI